MPYRFGDYTLDTERYELRRAGTLVKLRPKVFEVLAYLMAHRERVVSKQELLDQLWSQLSVAPATLHSCIRAARQAVGDTGQAQRVIQTLHGRGFRFVAELAGADPERHENATSSSPALASLLEPLGSPVAGGPVMMRQAPEPVLLEQPMAIEVEGEHKVLTVLCAGLAAAAALATQLGREAMHRLMQACFATAQRVMPQYGGTLAHIAGDGFVALFGAPLAHEDHARRAVLAAVALQQALQERQEGMHPAASLRIGVHTRCEGHCLAYGRAAPYVPVCDLLRQLCGIAEMDGPEAMATKVYTHLDAVGLAPADEAPYLLPVLGLAAEGDLLATPSPRRRPMGASCTSGGAPSTRRSSRPSNGCTPTVCARTSTNSLTMPSTASCGTRPSPTIGRPGRRPWRGRPTARLRDPSSRRWRP